jgi:hypothetical protein
MALNWTSASLHRHTRNRHMPLWTLLPVKPQMLLLTGKLTQVVNFSTCVDVSSRQLKDQEPLYKDSTRNGRACRPTCGWEVAGHP